MLHKIKKIFPFIKQRYQEYISVQQWKKTCVGLPPLPLQKKPYSHKNILFCHLFTNDVTIKAEIIFAYKLSKFGFQPVFLFANKTYMEKLVLMLCPHAQFIYFDNYIKAVSNQFSKDKADEFMQNIRNVRDYTNLSFKNSRIGKNSLSLLFRKTRKGSIDFNDSKDRELAKECLVYSIKSALAAEDIIKDRTPYRAFFCERGYTPAGEIFDACLNHQCDVIQWFGSPFPDSLMYKKYNLGNRDHHVMSVSKKSWEKIIKKGWEQAKKQVVIDKIKGNYYGGGWYNRQQLQENKVFLDKSAVKQKIGINSDKKIAVIFSHILYDATFFYGENIFDDYLQWLIETVRIAMENDNVEWVIKVHPVNVWRAKMDGKPMQQLEKIELDKKFAELPSHIHFLPADTIINTYSLYEAMDYGLTVRGTVGMELPSLGIPIITAGTGRYSGLGFTIDPQTKKQYEDILLNIENISISEEEIQRAQQFYYATIFLRPIPMQSFLIDFDKRQITINKDRLLKENNEVSNMLKWACDDTKEDFINL